jgi:hypothetical protein
MSLLEMRAASLRPPLLTRAPKSDGPDFLSETGALALKQKLESYWRERGYDVKVWVQEMGFHAAVRAVRYDVRSNLINGAPRG